MPYTMCTHTGKRGYASRKDARRARRELPKTTGHLTTYRCSVCERWHLGHPPAQVKTGEVARVDLQPHPERLT